MNADMLDELKRYTKDAWADWIRDILFHGIAFPFNRLTPEGDVLNDIAFLLRTKGVDTAAYEKALIDVLLSLYSEHAHREKAIRLLDAILHVKTPYAHIVVKQIVYERVEKSNLDEPDKILSFSFQIMSQLIWTIDERRDIDVMIRNKLMHRMRFDNSLSGNYVKFAYLNFGEKRLFSAIDFLLKVVYKQIPIAKRANFIVTIDHQIRDFYFERSFCFYGYFGGWIDLNSKVILGDDDEQTTVLKSLLKSTMAFLVDERDDFLESINDPSEASLCLSILEAMYILFDSDILQDMELVRIENMLQTFHRRGLKNLIQMVLMQNQEIIFDYFTSSTFDGSFMYKYEYIEVDEFPCVVRYFEEIRSQVLIDERMASALIESLLTYGE